MNILYGLNLAIFSAFFTLFSVEIGIALHFLFGNPDKLESMKKYISPIWEITGTFAVFYVVNFIATFPSAIVIIGTAYVVPLLMAALLFIFRNAFLAYGVYYESGSRSRYLKIYGAATIITAFFVIVVLSSAIGGYGFNMPNQIHLIQVLFNPFGISMFFAVALIALFVNSLIFNTERKALYTLFGAAGILWAVFAMRTYLSYSINGIVSNLPVLIISVTLLLVSLVFGVKRNRISSFLPFFFTFSAIVLFGFAVYPYWFGGTISSLNYLSSTATGYFSSIITVIGGTFVIVALLYFIRIVYLKQRGYK